MKPSTVVEMRNETKNLPSCTKMFFDKHISKMQKRIVSWSIGKATISEEKSQNPPKEPNLIIATISLIL